MNERKLLKTEWINEKQKTEKKNIYNYKPVACHITEPNASTSHSHTEGPTKTSITSVLQEKQRHKPTQHMSIIYGVHLVFSLI